MNVVTKVSPVPASISVPPHEQEQFGENKSKLMTETGMNFSLIVRLMVNGYTVEDREGERFVTFKLSE